MKIEEVRAYWGSARKFIKMTGIGQSNFYNWKRWGYIPHKAQLKIQELSGGKLVARYEDGMKK